MWSSTHRFSFLGPTKGDDEVGRSRAQLLVGRHGVVTRRALELEETRWDWLPIYNALSLMELRGEARRGYFVDHLPGVQFGDPSFVEEMRGPLVGRSNGVSVVNLRDPAYVMEQSLVRSSNDPRAEVLATPRSARSYAAFVDHEPVMVAHGNGDRIVTADVSQEILATALAALVTQLKSGESSGRLVVREWNGVQVLDTDGAELLRGCGFRRDYPHMVMEILGTRPLALNRR